MTKIRFDPFDRLTLFGRRWYFSIVREGNNEIMATSEAYNRPEPRDIAIAIIQEGAAEARIRTGKR
jgi:uncharacterized protein YegP (UPF0339 family)